MTGQYIVQGIFALAGIISLLASLRVVKNQFQLSNDASREMIPASAKIPCTIYCPVIV